MSDHQQLVTGEFPVIGDLKEAVYSVLRLGSRPDDLNLGQGQVCLTLFIRYDDDIKRSINLAGSLRTEHWSVGKTNETSYGKVIHWIAEGPTKDSNLGTIGAGFDAHVGKAK